MKYHKGKKFFYNSNSPFEQKILADLSEKEKKNRILPGLVTGGSVANSAYSLGVYMGAKTILLVGQDLAMTGNRTHADGTFQEKMDEIDVQNGEYLQVDAVGGGKVWTRDDFDRYRKWFEDCAKGWSHITMVDATEGGALIHGSKVMTLKRAIAKYCKRDFNVKWHIDRCKKLFQGENQAFALKYLIDSEKKLAEVKRRAKEGLRSYERMETLLRKPTVTDRELQKALKKVKKVNNYMERDYMAETVMDSLSGIEYTLRPSIYKVQNERKEELLDVAEHGKIILYAITVGTDEIAELARKTIIPYARERQAEADYVDNKEKIGNAKCATDKRRVAI